MQNPELANIEASFQALVRRAYDLGRNDALKKAVDALNADLSCSDQLALAAPEDPQPAPEEAHPKLAHEEMNGIEHTSASSPWWAWPVR